MRKKLLLARSAVLCILVLLSFPAFSQNKIISGKITDSAGRPLFGVSVIPKGSGKGATTDDKGEFHVSVSPQTKSLLFSSIGYATQEVPISGERMSVSLAPRQCQPQ